MSRLNTCDALTLLTSLAGWETFVTLDSADCVRESGRFHRMLSLKAHKLLLAVSVSLQCLSRVVCAHTDLHVMHPVRTLGASARFRSTGLTRGITTVPRSYEDVLTMRRLAQLSLLICRICLSLFTCDLPTNPRIKSSWSAWQGLPIPVPDTTRSTSGVADAGCFVQKPITCLKGALEWNRGPSRPALEGGAKA